MGKAIGDDAKRRLARGDSKERPKEIVIRSRRPLSSTEKRKSRFTITIDDGAATNRVPALSPVGFIDTDTDADADKIALSLSPTLL